MLMSNVRQAVITLTLFFFCLLDIISMLSIADLAYLTVSQFLCNIPVLRCVTSLLGPLVTVYIMCRKAPQSIADSTVVLQAHRTTASMPRKFPNGKCVQVALNSL